jgi:hypothetical protein
LGNFGLKVEERKCADLQHRELRRIHALLLTLHGSRRAALLNGRRSSGFLYELAHLYLLEEFEQVSQPAEALCSSA